MKSIKEIVLPVIILIVAAFGGMAADEVPGEAVNGNKTVYLIDY